MFNKKFTTKPFAAVKSSERRRLLSSACKRLGIDDSKLPKDIKNIMFPKDISIAKIELHRGERGSLLVDSRGKPLWVEFESTLIPTLYMLWECSFLLDVVVTPDMTVQFLENGADLMVRGVFEPYPKQLRKGDPVAVVRMNSPTVPIAVGTCLVNFDEIELMQSGKAVKIVSVVNDALMLSYIRDKVPIPEYLDRSFPVETEKPVEEPVKEITGEADLPKDSVEDKQPGKDDTVEESNVNIEQHPKDITSKQNEPLDDVDEITKDTADLTTLEDLPVESIDNYLKVGLLQVIKKTIGETPKEITASELVSQIMSNLASSHPSVQMKKSSWKKASKFIKAMDKEQLLKWKDRHGELIITSLSTGNPLVQQHIIYKPRTPKSDKAKATVVPDAPKDKNAGKYVVLKYWRPKSNVAPLLKKLQSDSKLYYNDEELKKLLNQYLASCLDTSVAQPKNKRFVMPDSELASALGFKANQPVEKVERGKLLAMLQKSCAPFHTVTPPDGEPSKMQKGGVPSLKLKTEKRTGTKVVTLVTGLEAFMIEPVLFAEELRVACAGSSTVGPAKNNPNASMVQIQGNQIKTITKILEQKGIRQEWIEK